MPLLWFSSLLQDLSNLLFQYAKSATLFLLGLFFFLCLLSTLFCCFYCILVDIHPPFANNILDKLGEICVSICSVVIVKGLEVLGYVFYSNFFFALQPAKKISDAKLAKEFRNALNEFQKSQRLAAERETMYAPYVPKILPSR